MTKGFVRLGTLVGLSASAIVVMAAACGKKRQVNPYDIGPVEPADEGGGRPDDGDGRPEPDLAAISVTIEERAVASYVDPNARLEYDFRYLAFQEVGAVQFASGKAELRLARLPVGVRGDLTLALRENGKERLKGELKDVTLKAGRNELALNLKESSGAGGDQEAELVLSISVEGAGNGGGGGSGGNGGGLSFAYVKPLSERYCTVCHAAAATEAFWTSRRNDIARRLDPSFARTMPQRGSDEQVQITDAERKSMIDFVTK